mmetsp:Transcript_19347/g.58173  ORF Transcript_19347/g.58173 Transcript_19347/m.58173 type:complete len:313 (-) Transcript_19347:1009-1947(-)
MATEGRPLTRASTAAPAVAFSALISLLAVTSFSSGIGVPMPRRAPRKSRRRACLRRKTSPSTQTSRSSAGASGASAGRAWPAAPSAIKRPSRRRGSSPAGPRSECNRWAQASLCNWARPPRESVVVPAATTVPLAARTSSVSQRVPSPSSSTALSWTEPAGLPRKRLPRGTCRVRGIVAGRRSCALAAVFWSRASAAGGGRSAPGPPPPEEPFARAEEPRTLPTEPRGRCWTCRTQSGVPELLVVRASSNRSSGRKENCLRVPFRSANPMVTPALTFRRASQEHTTTLPALASTPQSSSKEPSGRSVRTKGR